MERPDIFDYSDFRAYLKDMFEYRHGLDKKFNKAYICRQLGLERSRSYFQDILNGKYLSPYKLPLMSEVFELNKGEEKYFRVLVNYNQAFDEPDEREIYFEQLISLKQTSGYEVDKEQFEYYSHWYNPVIRATLDIADIDEENLLEIKEYIIPSITAKQIKEAIKLLTRLELIKPNEEGYLKPSEKVIKTPPYCRNEAILRFQSEVLEQAKHVLGTPPKTDLKKRTITKMLSFSEKGMEKLTAALERFSNEVNTIVSEDDNASDRVYQMLLSLFPYAKGANHE